MYIVIKITEWNDVERALGALGIQLRTSVDTFKSFDDLLEEIATKWDTFSSVQQAAIGTSLAGTRQREAFTTLMANWGDVSKYEELADNAYGTAVEKMKVYTDSIEAAKTRMSAALDKWVLQFSSGDIMKTFYNNVADVAENLAAWAGSIASIVAIMNAGKLIQGGAKILGNVGAGFMGIANSLYRIKSSKTRLPEVGSTWANVKETISDNFLTQQKSRYGSVLTKQIASMDGLTEGNKEELTAVLGTMQNIILNGESQNQSKIATELSNGATQEHFENLKKLISSENAVLISNNLLNGTTGELNSVIQLLKQAYLEQLIEINGRKAFGLNKNGEANWDFAPQQVKDKWAKKFKQEMASEENDAYLTIGALNRDTASKGGGKVGTYVAEGAEGVGKNIGVAAGQTAGKAMLTGIISMVSGAAGAWAGGVIGETLGGATGKAIGTTLMGTITSMLPAFGVEGMIVSGIISGVSLIFAGIKTVINKTTEKAKEEFQEAAEAYNNAKSMSSIAEKYDELSKGVDAYGRNLTLTDEEYSQFLEYSQQLVDVFPELYMRTDEQGNVIAKLGDEAESTADKVDKMTEALQRQADAKMVGDGSGQKVLKDALNTAYSEYLEAWNEQTKNKAIQKGFEQDLTRMNYTSNPMTHVIGSVISSVAGVGNSRDRYNLEGFQNYLNQTAQEQGVTVDEIRQGIADFIGTAADDELILDELNNSITAWGSRVRNYNNTTDSFLSKYGLTPESSSEDFANATAKIEQDLARSTANVDAQEEVLSQISRSLSDYAVAYARYNNLLLGMSDDMTTITTTAVEQVSAIDYTEVGTPKLLSEEEFKARVEAVVNAMREIFDGNSELQDLALGANNATTQGDFMAAQEKLLNSILNSNEFNELVKNNPDTAKQLLISLGFQVDDDSAENAKDWVVFKAKDFAQQLEQQGKLGNGLTASFINSLSQEDAAQAYKWINSGYITDNKSLQTALGFQSEAKDVIQSHQRTQYFRALMRPREEEGTSLYEDRLRSFYSGLNKFYLEREIDEAGLKSAIGQQFSDMGPETWEGLYQNASEYLNDDARRLGEDFSKELQNSILLGLNDEVNALQENAKLELDFAFGELDVGDAVDSWSDLKAIFEAIDSTVDDLNSAFEEQNKVGHLGIQTVLGLLSSNANYIEALEVADGQIRLKADAEQIMMKVQVQAAIASIQALIAEKQARAQEIKAQMAQLEASGSYQESVSDTIKALNTEGEAVTNLTNAYLGLADAINLIGEKDPEDGVRTAKEADEWLTRSDAQWNKIQGDIVKSTNLEATLRRLASEYEQITGEKVNFYYDTVTKKMLKSPRENQMVVLEEEGSSVDSYNLHSSKIRYDFSPGDGKSGTIPIAENLLDGLYEVLDAGGSLSVWSKVYKPGEAADEANDVAEAYRELIQALDELIDKEYESMQAFNRTGLEQDTQYYKLKEESLKRIQTEYIGQLATIQTALEQFAGQSEDELKTNATWLELKKEEADVNKELIQVYKDLENLDDERVSDQINIHELQGASVETMIKLQREYIATADTQQELVERQKELNSLIQEEIKLRKEVNEFYRTNEIDRRIERTKIGAYDSKEFDNLIAEKDTSLKAEQGIIEEGLKTSFLNAVQAYMQDGYSYAEAVKKAINGSNEYSQEVREWLNQWYENFDEQVQNRIDAINAKTEDLERTQKKIQDERPDEWISIDQINNSYGAELAVIENKATLLKSVLENDKLLAGMTSEQIIELTNAYNEAILEQHETQVKLREARKDLQEKQYDAIKYQINLYTDELQDAIDDINDAYDDQLNKIRENNEELQRQVELEDLLAAKKRANKEKERVYRQGIGWVYESNRSSQKQAQDDLDDFYRQDYIDDLEKTRDAEVQILQDRIEAWENYLKNLEWNMNEFERLQNSQILMRLMGVTSQEEIDERLKGDMLLYNENASANYKNFDTIFKDNLINPYKENLQELQNLYEQEKTLLNARNALYEVGSVLDIVNNNVDYQHEINEIKRNASNYDENGNLTAEARKQIDALEALRNEKIESQGLRYDKTYDQSSYDDYRTDKTIADYKYEYEQAKARGDWQGMAAANEMANYLRTGKKGQITATVAIEAAKKKSESKGFADGILGGPVTYTGLAMLHGSPSSPEYVLNSEQAYNILRNMATTRLPEITSNMANQNGGTSYVVQGDVVLENVNDPAEFWDSVTDAMRSRYNVTKNSRG